jgi:hypothetical protein
VTLLRLAWWLVATVNLSVFLASSVPYYGQGDPGTNSTRTMTICEPAGGRGTNTLLTSAVVRVAATNRASFYLYTIPEEIDRLVEGLHKVRKTLGNGASPTRWARG